MTDGFANRAASLPRSRGRIRRYWAAAGFWSYWVGSLHEFVGWFLGRVPLDHLHSANITIDAAAVSNGQFGIAHAVLRPAVPTDKVIAIGERWGAHRGIICASAPQNASARRSHLIFKMCKIVRGCDDDGSCACRGVAGRHVVDRVRRGGGSDDLSGRRKVGLRRIWIPVCTEN